MVYPEVSDSGSGTSSKRDAPLPSWQIRFDRVTPGRRNKDIGREIRPFSRGCPGYTGIQYRRTRGLTSHIKVNGCSRLQVRPLQHQRMHVIRLYRPKNLHWPSIRCVRSIRIYRDSGMWASKTSSPEWGAPNSKTNIGTDFLRNWTW